MSGSSFLGWIDHDPEERQRTQRVLALFRERETRDELGFGAVRDAIADTLFPGTSTIETRLRYTLFVPWLYRRLEDRRTLAERPIPPGQARLGACDSAGMPASRTRIAYVGSTADRNCFVGAPPRTDVFRLSSSSTRATRQRSAKFSEQAARSTR